MFVHGVISLLCPTNT